MYSYSPFVDNDKMVATPIRSQYTFSNCVISSRCELSIFSHRVNGKNIESEPEQFKHQNSVLLYPNTENHKNQAFRYLKQYIILCDLCYDATFLNSSMPQSVVSRHSFSANIRSTRLGFISDWNDWCMSCGCIACDIYRHTYQRDY